jgi:phospholipid/cholesterol/gamma-HCH transport system permease protein
VWSFVAVLAMATGVMVVHTYYGFTATGGPAGVGEAVGRSVRSSMIVTAFVCLMISR